MRGRAGRTAWPAGYCRPASLRQFQLPPTPRSAMVRAYPPDPRAMACMVALTFRVRQLKVAGGRRRPKSERGGGRGGSESARSLTAVRWPSLIHAPHGRAAAPLGPSTNLRNRIPTESAHHEFPRHACPGAAERGHATTRVKEGVELRARATLSGPAPRCPGCLAEADSHHIVGYES